MNTTANAAAGTYYPNVPGARTLRDSKPLYLGDKRVSATVAGDGSYAVHIGTETVAEGMLDGTEGELMVFFAAEAIIAASEAVTVATKDVDAAVEAIAADESLTEDQAELDAVTTVRSTAAELLALAEKAESSIDPHTKPRRGMSTMDPRHPSRAAETFRKQAAVLASWTVEDERNYGQYVSDGIGDTDGWFAPIARAPWKLTLGQ